MWSACVVYHRPALFRQLLYAVAAAGPAVFQCLYDDDDVETFFIFFYFFSSIFSLTSTAILVFHRMCSEEIISIRRFKMTAQRLLMVQF
jgi:hypothetical protein